MRAFFCETTSNGQVKRKLHLVQLGVMITKTNMSTSPLVKYRSVARYDKELNKNYQIGIVVRLNGRVEVYSDFMLVNEYFNLDLQCVDVETDFNQFYLKFVKNSGEIDQAVHTEADLDYEIRQIRHFWRN